ncbi:class I SAM-dependent DNA methyltransferase [Aurantiacibacter rhizosphaerae]|uniref:Methyltransferase domain-containing protein n=1 Tax=Aurantiacibacter rhizosphaerae TaxID=2691582 RepID=A0A844XFK3_9SPHN|nr:class I SAM-dependent methyltransferase [Aurantiacibacter rhizosphaerae]MWV28348.1 methyltransferase domain-containing protein [Aurantiacibacter rhizosphaerae]
MTDEATLAFYDREAPSYTMSFAQGPARHLDAFLDRLVQGAHILELGCGGGRDASRMLERGFTVDMTDGSSGMATKAKERTGQDVRLLRFDQLGAVEAYDAVWAHASLHHQPLAGLGDVLTRIYRATRKDGWFFANYKLGNGDARDTFGRLYNFSPREHLLQLYREAGWSFEEIEDYRAGGLDKVERDWIAITARKHG